MQLGELTLQNARTGGAGVQDKAWADVPPSRTAPPAEEGLPGGAPAEAAAAADRGGSRDGSAGAAEAHGDLLESQRPPMVPLPMYDEFGWLRPGFAPPPPPPGTPPPPSPPASPASPGAEAAAAAAAAGADAASALALREAGPATGLAWAGGAAAAPRDLSSLTGAALARMGLIPRGTGPTGSISPGFNSKGFPMRPGMPMCSYYTRTGNCAYGVTCKWDHPERAAGR